MQPANSVNIQNQAYLANYQTGHMEPGQLNQPFVQATAIPNTFITQNPLDPTFITYTPQPPRLNHPLPLAQPLQTQPVGFVNPWMNFRQINPQIQNTMYVPLSSPPIPPPPQTSFQNNALLTQPISMPRNHYISVPRTTSASAVPGNQSIRQTTSNSSLRCYSSSEGASTCAGIGRSRTPEVPESLMRQYKQATKYAGRGRGRTFVSTPPSQQKKGPPQKRYPHRSKQRKIESTTQWIESVAKQRGVFAAPRELVRGRQVFQCHAKTFQACKDVRVALQKVLKNENIQVLRIACPFSRKNEFQKKGFILYVKVKDEVQVLLAEQIFIDEGLKVRRAVSKEERLQIEAEIEAEKNASIAIKGCKISQFDVAHLTSENNGDCGILCERKNSSRKNSSIDDSKGMQYNPESAIQGNFVMNARSRHE